MEECDYITPPVSFIAHNLFINSKTNLKMTETEQTLRERFTAFLQAMYDWETEANRVDEEEVGKKKTLSWEDFCKKQTELRIPIYK